MSHSRSLSNASSSSSSSSDPAMTDVKSVSSGLVRIDTPQAAKVVSDAIAKHSTCFMIQELQTFYGSAGGTLTVKRRENENYQIDFTPSEEAKKNSTTNWRKSLRFRDFESNYQPYNRYMLPPLLSTETATLTAEANLSRKTPKPKTEFFGIKFQPESSIMQLIVAAHHNQVDRLHDLLKLEVNPTGTYLDKSAFEWADTTESKQIILKAQIEWAIKKSEHHYNPSQQSALRYLLNNSFRGENVVITGMEDYVIKIFNRAHTLQKLLNDAAIYSSYPARLSSSFT